MGFPELLCVFMIAAMMLALSVRERNNKPIQPDDPEEAEDYDEPDEKE